MLKNLCQKMFGRSLWVYHANSGGCNGCDIEVLNVLTPYYDVERFGIKLVGSPRHADVMLCQGPAMRATARALRAAYEAMPAPKLVFAIGGCACGGGIWHDSYPVLGLVDKVVAPVQFKQLEMPIPRYHPADLKGRDEMVVYEKAEKI